MTTIRTQLQSSPFEEVKSIKFRLITFTQTYHFPEDNRNLKNRILPSSSFSNHNPLRNGLGIIFAKNHRFLSLALTRNEQHPKILPHDPNVIQITSKFVLKSKLHGGNLLTLRITKQIRTNVFNNLNHNKSPAVLNFNNGKNFVGAAELFKKYSLEFIKSLQFQVLRHRNHQFIKRTTFKNQL